MNQYCSSTKEVIARGYSCEINMLLIAQFVELSLSLYWAYEIKLSMAGLSRLGEGQKSIFLKKEIMNQFCSLTKKVIAVKLICSLSRNSKN